VVARLYEAGARHVFVNAMMGMHRAHESWRAGVDKMVLVGTVCACPKLASTPFREEDRSNGYPEETNAPYGLAKRMLLVQAYRQEYGFNAVYLLPTNLYGPGDEFDPKRSYVTPALVRMSLEAVDQGLDTIEPWGRGSPSREFTGEIRWERTRPDGQPAGRLDTSRARELFEFEAEVPLRDGLRRPVDWYRAARAAPSTVGTRT
jgi:GDP-L-fucose synthase